MKIGAVIQARMGSTRLPGKVMLDLLGKSVIQRVLDRVRLIRDIDIVIVAVPDTPASMAIDTGPNTHKFYGNELDVLDRYYSCALANNLDIIVRITSDCPLLDPEVSSRVLEGFRRGNYDYYSNVHPPTYPDGLDTEVFTMGALCKAWTHARGSEREHVTPYIWKRPYKFILGNLVYPKDLSFHRWTLDTTADYEYIKCVYEAMGDRVFGMNDILDLPKIHTLTRL